MDENSAWEHFAATGSVEDYLAYCQCKVQINGECVNKGSVEIHEDNHRRTDHIRADRRGKGQTGNDLYKI